jgi:hypothetical protein
MSTTAEKGGGTCRGIKLLLCENPALHLMVHRSWRSGSGSTTYSSSPSMTLLELRHRIICPHPTETAAITASRRDGSHRLLPGNRYNNVFAIFPYALQHKDSHNAISYHLEGVSFPKLLQGLFGCDCDRFRTRL